MVRNLLFVCYGNAFRSQMAEGFFNYHNKNKKYAAVSAGTHPFGRVPETTKTIMQEKGIDISGQSSKRLAREMIDDAYKIYVLYEDDFSDLPQQKLVSIPIEDPFGESPEEMRRIRDEIEKKVLGILAGL